MSFVCLPLLSANASTPGWKTSPHIRITAAVSDKQVFCATRANHLIAGCRLFFKTCLWYSFLVPFGLIPGFKGIVHPFTHPHVVPNPYDILPSKEYNWRSFEECSSCSHTYNEDERAVRLQKRIIKAVNTWNLYVSYYWIFVFIKHKKYQFTVIIWEKMNIYTHTIAIIIILICS